MNEYNKYLLMEQIRKRKEAEEEENETFLGTASRVAGGIWDGMFNLLSGAKTVKDKAINTYNLLDSMSYPQMEKLTK